MLMAVLVLDLRCSLTFNALGCSRDGHSELEPYLNGSSRICCELYYDAALPIDAWSEQARQSKLVGFYRPVRESRSELPMMTYKE